MASDDKRQTLRDTVFKESFDLSQKMRLGMFSVPVSTAIGDDTYFKTKPARRDAEGNVITDPRNFTTKNPKKGHIDSVLFSKPEYISIGDPFKEPQRVPMRDSKKDGFKSGGHDLNFKPAKTVQRTVKADFEHMTDFKEVSKSRKAPEGGVITEPKNFLTSPPKKGIVGKGTTFTGNIEHLPDPFDTKKEIARKERQDHQSKVQDKPFSQKVKGIQTFATIKEVFGEDRNYPQKQPPSPKSPLMTHDIPFKPSNPPKRGYNKTLEKFPEYKEDPLKEITRKKEEEGSSSAKWKPTHNAKTVPTPSISTQYKNLKTEIPLAFQKF